MLCSMSFADHYFSLCLKTDILRERESQREECFAPCSFLAWRFTASLKIRAACATFPRPLLHPIIHPLFQDIFAQSPFQWTIWLSFPPSQVSGTLTSCPPHCLGSLAGVEKSCASSPSGMLSCFRELAQSSCEDRNPLKGFADLLQRWCRFPSM